MCKGIGGCRAITLTTATDDDFIGTANNDTFVATTATDDAGDSLLDISTTDADVLNWTVTANPAAIGTIKNIETINLTTETGADITFDMTNVSGVKAVNAVRNDYLDGLLDGTGTVDIDTAVGGVAYSFGTQVDDAEVNFDADGSLAATIATGADLATLLVDNVGEEGVTITAAAADVAVTVDGLGDTDADGNGNDAVTLSASGDASINLTNGGDVVELLSVSGNGAALTLDITGNVEEITVTGDQDVTLVASAAELTGEKLTNSASGAVVVSVDTAGALDLSDFDIVDNVVLDADFNNTTVTVNSGQLVSTAVDQNGAANALTIAAADTSVAAVAVNAVSFAVTDNEDADNGVAFDDLVFTNFATVSINGAAEEITAVDLTANGADVTITGGNDFTLTGVATADMIDASAVTGDVDLGTLAAANITVKTGSGDDTVATGAGGVVSASLGDGRNTLTINAVAAGSSFITGAGIDTVTLSGTNSLALVTGDGNDTVTMTVAADAVINAGAGTDTLVVDGAADIDVSANTNFSLSGFEVISLADGLEVSLAQFAGMSSVEIQGTTAKVLTVNGTDTANTIDLSNLVFKVGTTSTTVVEAGAGADTITGSDAADSITGGTGADTMTGGLGDDVFVIASGDTGITLATADTITDFVTGADTINLDSLLNSYAEADGTGYADFAAFVAAAEASFVGTAADGFVAFNAAGS